MAKDVPLLNFSDDAMRQFAIKYLKGLDGLYWFDVRKCKDQRTLKQNAYYWGVVLYACAKGMAEASGEPFASDEMHEFFKDRFLKKPVVNRTTGELLGHTAPSTTSLDKAEFAHYLNQIISFASDYLNTRVPEARLYYQDEPDQPVAKKVATMDFSKSR